MKIYSGHATASGPGPVSVIETSDTGEASGLPLEHHVLHSPDGFSWGYLGSGPAELARCLLWDHLGAEPVPALYQDFKAEMVGVWPLQENWRLSQTALEDWLGGWRVGHPDWAETVEEAKAELDLADTEVAASPPWPRRLVLAGGGHVFMQPGLSDADAACPMLFSCSSADDDADLAVELTSAECLELAKFLLGEALFSVAWAMLEPALDHAPLR